MKKIISIILLTSLVLFASCSKPGNTSINLPDFKRIADGTYRGNSSSGPVRVTLDVTVKGGNITSIEIIDSFHGRGRDADGLIPRIIQAQSVNVDAISGATRTSTTILNAVKNALAPGSK